MPIIITETNQINISNLYNVIFVKYSDTNCDNRVATQIANNTAQTWQENRGHQETLNNTIQGKVAEELFHLYLSESYPEINMLSYDEIRNDNYRKHAPFDFLTWIEDCDTDGIVRAIQNDIFQSSYYVRLSQRTKNLCRDENVKILEVKSTKIIDRHKRQCAFNPGDYDDLLKVKSLVRIILNDDYLTYPHLCRKTTDDYYSATDYIELLQSRFIEVRNEEEMRLYELSEQLADAFVRIYIDEVAHIGFIVGWIDKQSFYNNAIIKRMAQRGKSESALYFATSLNNGKSIDCFSTLFNI